MTTPETSSSNANVNPADLTTQGGGPAPYASSLSTAMADLMQAKGIAPIPSDAPPPGPGETPLQEPPAGDPPPPQEPPAATDGKKPTPAPLTPAQLLDRVAQKDKLYQDERNGRRTAEQKAADVEKAHQELLGRLRADPMAVLREHNIRFGDLAMQALAGDGKTPPPAAQPGKPGGQPAPAQSPELQALQARLDEQDAFISKLRERDQQAEAKRQDEESLKVLRDFMPEQQFPLVSELGLHSEVRKRVQQHIGAHGGFADEREAEETLHFYAREVESEEEQRLRERVGKPGIRSFLSKELGLAAGSSTQREATPARQVNEGNRAVPNPRPALSNDLTTQRSVVSPPQSWDHDEALRRTIAEMSALRGS